MVFFWVCVDWWTCALIHIWVNSCKKLLQLPWNEMFLTKYLSSISGEIHSDKFSVILFPVVLVGFPPGEMRLVASSLIEVPGDGFHFHGLVLVVELSLTAVWSSTDPNSGPDLQPEPRPALRATRCSENLHTPTSKTRFTSGPCAYKWFSMGTHGIWQEKKTHLCLCQL